MKEPGSYAEAAAVERDGWAADDSDDEGQAVKVKGKSQPIKWNVLFLDLLEILMRNVLFPFSDGTHLLDSFPSLLYPVG